jgi:hypothetical protein
MSEQSKLLVRRALEGVWNRGNFAIVCELAASDIIIHASRPGEDIHGSAGITKFYTTLRQSMQGKRR